MIESAQRKHFYSRAGFGIPAGAEGLPPGESLKSQIALKPVNVVAIDKPQSPPADKDMVKEKLKKNRSEVLALNAAWFSQLTDPQSVIREKMTFFWHDHFACRSKIAYLAQQQINTLRQHALASFGDLLMAISKDPAMLHFLNNQQNRKDSPNENFAREVMELFTLGRGNYSESDIKNAARAFTGWSFNPATGQFIIRPRQHDYESKTFRGNVGNFSGEDVINMILEDKQTAAFVTRKITSFFAGDVEGEVVNSLADDFFRSGYDIEKLLAAMYTSEWFYKKDLVGNRIKSPVELVAGIQTHTGGLFTNPLNITYLQKTLGQVLLQPPNVSGWPNGREWIDSSSLAFRMSLPKVLLSDAESQIVAKDDGDVNNDANKANKASKISFSVNMDRLASLFTKKSANETLEAIEAHLLACPALEDNRKFVAGIAGRSHTDPEFIKKAFIGFMSLPEYQLS